jgi:hypothetical protein
MNKMSVMQGNKDKDDEDVAEGVSSATTDESIECGARFLLDQLIAYEETGDYKARMLFERVAHQEASRLLRSGTDTPCAALTEVLKSIQQETNAASDSSAAYFSRRARQLVTDAFPGIGQDDAIGNWPSSKSVNKHRLTTCETCRKVIEGYKFGKRIGVTQDLEDLLGITPPLSEMAKESPWIFEVEKLADVESNSQAQSGTGLTELHKLYLVSKATLESRRNIERICTRQATKLRDHPNLCLEGKSFLNGVVEWTASAESYTSFLGRAEKVFGSMRGGEEGAPSYSAASTAPTEE